MNRLKMSNKYYLLIAFTIVLAILVMTNAASKYDVIPDIPNNCTNPGEQYFECSTIGCQPSCIDPTPFCNEVCRKPGNCDCGPGLVRNTKNGQCVDPKEPSCKDQLKQYVQPICDEDEEYYNCSTIHCQLTCIEPNPVCSGECKIPGNCDCKDGLVRNTKTGKCVDPKEKSCKAQSKQVKKYKCNEDEQYYNCSTIGCQRTCLEPNPVCNKDCRKPGNCDCKPGLVRDTKSCKCVDPNEESCIEQSIQSVDNTIQQNCSEDEQYYEFSTIGCQPTCMEPNPVCMEKNKTPGNCDCKVGLVRDTKTGKCVDPNENSCKDQSKPSEHKQQSCAEDEYYYKCSTIGFQRTCMEPNLVCNKDCKKPGNCDCKLGLVRNTKTGQCVDPNEESCIEQSIPIQSVQQNCSEDEQYYEFSTIGCQRTCKEPNPVCPIEGKTPGNCDCKVGLVRDTKCGKCVNPNEKSCKIQSEQCKRPICGADEQYYKCSTIGCQKTCKNLNPVCDIDECRTPGNCDCKKGLVRDTLNNLCVDPNEENCLDQRIDKNCYVKGEKFYVCSTKSCERTCAEPLKKCDDKCVKPGNCDCIEGLVRDVITGQCVDPNENSCVNQRNGFYICTKPDEVYYNCSTRSCQRTCTEPLKNCVGICETPGNCDCKEDLVRDLTTGKCVYPNDWNCREQREGITICPNPDHIYYEYNTKNCPRTCRNPYPTCTKFETPGNCDCKPELLFNTLTGKCCKSNLPECQAQRNSRY